MIGRKRYYIFKSVALIQKLYYTKLRQFNLLWEKKTNIINHFEKNIYIYVISGKAVETYDHDTIRYFLLVISKIADSKSLKSPLYISQESVKAIYTTNLKSHASLFAESEYIVSLL